MKYPLWIRLTLLPIGLIIALPLWLILGIVDMNRLSKALIQTGKNFETK